MNNIENLKNFIYTAYDIALSKDKIKINIIKKQILILIKQIQKKTLLEYTNAIFNQIYYFFIQNKIDQDVNKNNLKVLSKEIHILFFLKKNFKNPEKITNETILCLFIQLLEYLIQIDFTRINFMNENLNLEKSILSTHFITDIDKLLNKEEKIQEDLKRNLKLS